MLSELVVHDLALIDGLEISFGPSLNAITGETGAGKSLVVGSLELLLGEAPRGGAANWLRAGAAAARVEGRFTVDDEAVRARVAAVLEQEVPVLAETWRERCAAGEPELILGRTLTAEGRTKAHVDQRPVPLRALRAVASTVLEIHGQNEHQRLFEPAEQRVLLDAFGGAGAELAAYRTARDGWREACERRDALEAARAERRDRLDLLRFQLRELEAAAPRPGERAELDGERRILRNAGDLSMELGGVLESLQDADGSALERLQRDAATVERWADELPELAGALEDLRTARLHVEEAVGALVSLLDRVEVDPARLELVEERLSELERLERKYATDEAGLVARIDELRDELVLLEDVEGGLAVLAEQVAQAREATRKAARRLTARRREAAASLEKGALAALAALGLARASLRVDLAPRKGEDPEAHSVNEVSNGPFGPDGAEDVELFLAANPGELERPLRHVASGGEAARIMLALRTALLACDRGRTLVFDEVDAGVGGRLGPAVAGHLAELAANHQVLCVTHLPAIAARADHHLRVAKETRGGRTRAAIEVLDAESRVGEVADMIAGGAKAETARAEARRLLERPPAPGRRGKRAKASS